MDKWLFNAGKLTFMFLFLTTVALAQNGKFSGKVTGANGEVVVGASAVLKGSTKGDTTNTTGVFTIDNIANGAHTVVISSIGFTGQDMKVTVPGGENRRIIISERGRPTSLTRSDYPLLVRPT